MADIEKIKTGIFEMLQRNTWQDIDEERHRFQPVLNDALELLKEQNGLAKALEQMTATNDYLNKEIERLEDMLDAKEPILLTLDEVANAKYPTDIFCEIKDDNRVFAVTAPVPKRWIWANGIRYWTARPTDEQRKAEPWKDGEQE